jgi:NitT/TauT family transport system permease protein
MRAVPVLVVIAIALAAMYPLALLLGWPLARQRMDNLANWIKATATLAPLADAPADAAADAPAGTRLRFGTLVDVSDEAAAVQVPVDPARAVLVVNGRPLTGPDGEPFLVGEDFLPGEVELVATLGGPLLTWGASFEGPLDAAGVGAAGHLFRFLDPADLGAPLYLGGRLLAEGSVESDERADGVRTSFRFPAATGPVLVGDALLVEGEDFVGDGEVVELTTPPTFNVRVRRVTGDYAVVDAASGTIALVGASAEAPRAAASVVALAERLVGEVDGVNRTFRLQHTPLVDTDPARRLFVGERELSATPERPAERVDGERNVFTFDGERGIVTVDGVEAVEGRDYTRDGNQVVFTRPPRRNAALRQYRDYLVRDLSAGSVLLAEAPAPDSALWAASYTYYDRPSCGETVMACFLSMPQHPMPFPHWIADRIAPFLTAYPVTDARNVVRAVAYTAGGTLAALVLGALVGIVLAVAFVMVRPFEQALLPWVIASQTVPIIALVPVLLLILGNAGITVQTSLVPTALIGAYIAFFPITVGTVTGLRSVDPLALDLMKSYAATPLQVFWKVRFPAAVPFFFTSLKLGTAAALVGALVAETESNNRRGLGYAIVGQVQAGDVSDVWLLLIVSALLGIGLVALVGVLQRVIAPWERV